MTHDPLPSRHDLVVLGDLVADLIVPMERLPLLPNNHGWAEGIFLEPGGAGNVLVAARRLNLSVAALGQLGADRYGAGDARHARMRRGGPASCRRLPGAVDDPLHGPRRPAASARLPRHQRRTSGCGHSPRIGTAVIRRPARSTRTATPCGTSSHPRMCSPPSPPLAQRACRSFSIPAQCRVPPARAARAGTRSDRCLACSPSRRPRSSPPVKTAWS